MWRALALVLAGCTAAGCGGEERAAARSGYVVQVDLAPHIAALGEDDLTADEAAERLAALGVAVVPALDAALGREPAEVRARVVGILAQLDAATAVPPLLRVARSDADADVRAEALRALGALGDPRGMAPVGAALDDPLPALRGSAVQACARLCTAPEMVERIADLAIRDPDTSVVLAARATLGTLHAQGGATAGAVRAAIDRRRQEALPADATPDRRALAALLAAGLDGAAAAPSLAALAPLVSPPQQRQIAWFLGEQGDAAAVAPLRELLTARDPLVQAYAYDALVKLRTRGAAGADAALAAYSGQKPLRALRPPEF